MWQWNTDCNTNMWNSQCKICYNKSETESKQEFGLDRFSLSRFFKLESKCEIYRNKQDIFVTGWHSIDDIEDSSSLFEHFYDLK